jgi:hypothetical protein
MCENFSFTKTPEFSILSVKVVACFRVLRSVKNPRVSWILREFFLDVILEIVEKLYLSNLPILLAILVFFDFVLIELIFADFSFLEIFLPLWVNFSTGGLFGIGERILPSLSFLELLGFIFEVLAVLAALDDFVCY